MSGAGGRDATVRRGTAGGDERPQPDLVGQVDAVGKPGFADSTGPQQHVDPAARAEVQYLLTLPKLRHGNGGYRRCRRPARPCHEMDIALA